MRTRVGIAIAVAVVMTTGCTNTIKGAALRDAEAAPSDVRPLRESQLDGVMLSIDQLNGIVGATQLEVVVDAREMSDSAGDVSDPDCLGSIYGAEAQVYRESGWTAVRDQVAREPQDGNRHWIEQTVVRYPTEKQAKDFVGVATASWQDCSGFSVAVEDEVTNSIWLIGDVVRRGDVLTQVIAQEDSDGWECQHAQTSVANLSIEALACAFGIDDEAVRTVDALVANAARQ